MKQLVVDLDPQGQILISCPHFELEARAERVAVVAELDLELFLEELAELCVLLPPVVGRVEEASNVPSRVELGKDSVISFGS